MKSSSTSAPRRASVDAQSGLSASSSSLFSDVSWGSDGDEEIVARHLGMSDKSLQDHLEYKKKDDTSSLSTASTLGCADDVDSFGTDADTNSHAIEKDAATNSYAGGACARRVRRRASVRESIVSLSGTVLESIQECDDSSGEEATDRTKGASVTFVKFAEAEPAGDASISEESLHFDDIFGTEGIDVDGDGELARGHNEDALSAGDTAAVSKEFNNSADTKESTSSTRSIIGSTSRSSSSNKSGKPDPPESPRAAFKVHYNHGSAFSLHIDKLRQVLPNKCDAASSSARPFEITDVFIPQDAADSVVSGINEFSSGTTNKDFFSTNPSHFTSGSGDAITSDDNEVSCSSILPLLHREDSDGNLISGMINDLKEKLSEVSDNVDIDSLMNPRVSSAQSRHDATCTGTSLFLDIVKDVKLELANLNMMVDSYRMKQRHLMGENELLVKKHRLLEEQVENLNRDNSVLQFELQVSKDAIRTEQTQLQESNIIQKKLRIELEELQCRLEEASKSEQQANLTMMNVMHHKNNASTMEFLDFAPDIEKLRSEDGGTARTDDMTHEQVGSKRSLFSSIASNLGADGSSRTIRSESLRNVTVDSTPSTLPERWLLRRLSNMFAEVGIKEQAVEGGAQEEFGKDQHTSTSSTNEWGSAEVCPENQHSESFPLPDEAPGRDAPRPATRRLPRRHSDDPQLGDGSASSSNARDVFPRRASVGFIYSSRGTRGILPPSSSSDGKDQIEETTPPNTAPTRRRLQNKTDSLRSVNTHNDVADFMADFVGNASASTFKSDLGSIQEQGEM